MDITCLEEVATSALARRSPLNFILGRQVFMVFRAYFDGSGKSNDTSERVVSLACCSGEDRCWALIEQLWRPALEAGPRRAEYMHIADAMADPPRGEFLNWSPEEIRSLIYRLLDVVRKANPLGLRAFTFTVNLDLYRTWRSCLGWAKHPERECATWCFYRCLETYMESPKAGVTIFEGVDAFFDQNEDFMKYIVRYWQDKGYRKRYPILTLVRSVTPVDMKLTPPVQVADMIAWEARYSVLGSSNQREPLCRDIREAISRKSVRVDERQLRWLKENRADSFLVLPPDVPH